MLVASRNGFAVGSAIPDVDSYAGFSEAWSFFDGIRNVGASAPHDDSSRTWCDLARNDTTFALNESWSFGDKGLNTTVGTGIEFGGVNANNYFADATSVSEMTYECVFDLVAFAQVSGNNLGGRLGIEMANQGLIFYGEPWGVRYYMWAWAQGNYSYNASSALARGLMSIAAVWSATQGTIKLYINNSLKNTKSIGGDWKFGGQLSHKARFNRAYSIAYGLTGTYHRISIVKRALSDQELTANYLLDQQRFSSQ